MCVYVRKYVCMQILERKNQVSQRQEGSMCYVCVCMQVYVYVYLYVYMCIYACKYIYLQKRIHAHVYLYEQHEARTNDIQ